MERNAQVGTLTGSALGSLIGGLLASPLGPWAAVGGATVGTTLGGYLASKVWREFYADLGEHLTEARRLLEAGSSEEAAQVLHELREHPRYADQEENFRSELESVLVEVLRALGQSALEEGSPERALAHFRSARKFRPRDPEILWSLIRAGSTCADPRYEESGSLQADLEELLRFDPAHVAARRALAGLLERQGRKDAAADLLVEGASREGIDPAAAEDLLRAALRLEPGLPRAVTPLATALLDSARGREAEDLLEAQGSNLPPRKRSLLMGRAHILMARWDEALKSLEPLIDLPSDEARLWAGVARARKGDARRAVDLLSPLSASGPQARAALLELVPLQLELGELDQVRNHLDRPEVLDDPARVKHLKRLAEAFERVGRDEEARRVYDQVENLGDTTSFWGRFTLERKDGSPVILGASGMGRVYLGRRRSDSLSVAIRDAPLPSALGGKGLRRFEREVDLLSRLSHPNIIRLYGHALPEGKCLLAMELCPAGDLRQKMRDRMKWADIKAVLQGVTAGLAYLHHHDPCLVHRNLKPSNILFMAGGEVKLADFSLARASRALATSVVTSVHERASLYAYQAPERILDDPDLGPPADVFSLGCILYELLTGQTPFVFADVNRQIRAHLEDSPRPPSRLASWIPPALDDFVSRCLAREPGDRFPDAQAAWKALEPL